MPEDGFKADIHLCQLSLYACGFGAEKFGLEVVVYSPSGTNVSDRIVAFRVETQSLGEAGTETLT